MLVIPCSDTVVRWRCPDKTMKPFIYALIRWWCHSMALWSDGDVVRWHCDQMMMSFDGTVIRWWCRSMALWSDGDVVQWHCDQMVMSFDGTVVRWWCRSMALWSDADALWRVSASDSQDSEGEDLSTIRPSLIRELRNILDLYPDDGQILKVGCEKLFSSWKNVVVCNFCCCLFASFPHPNRSTADTETQETMAAQ